MSLSHGVYGHSIFVLWCCDVLQVYAVCSELINMFENYRVPISQEECRRLLAAVRLPQPLPAAAAAATPPQQHQQ
jgi:hypothetical protein